MRTITTRLSLLVLFLVMGHLASAQNVTLTGTILDDENLPMIGASVLVKGTTMGAFTDMDGKFSLVVPEAESITLSISFVGYQRTELVVTPPYGAVTIKMEASFIPGQEVVITASRVSESILESPVSVQKISSKEIRTAASGDFYDGLGNLTEIDVVSSSAGMKVINTRGFNTTAPVRFVQFVDGVDNQAPGLNFPIGNLVGANDLDIHSVEIISGAASALYGPNAFQGVISMNTKNPYDYTGLSLQVKGGDRGYYDVQGRYAGKFGKKDQFAFKLNAAYMHIEDWPATDPEANVYGDIEADINMSEIIRDLPNGTDITEEEREDFIKLLNYLDFNQAGFPDDETVNAPGYNETDLADYDSKSLKLNPSLHYRFGKDMEVNYSYRFGRGTAVYQGTNRYSINDILFQQHRAEIKGRNWFLRGYTTKENAGDSYDMVFSAVNISKFGATEWVKEYLGAYFDTLRVYTDSFDRDTKQWMADSASIRARAHADSTAWLAPGDFQFDSLFNAITTNPDLQEGSKFVDESSLQHIEFQYNIDQLDFLDIVTGATFRRYRPRSFGTIFSDTLINPGDTLPSGMVDFGAEFVSLNTYEFGAYVQASKDIGGRLKLIASIRVDKNRNYDAQASPRGSIIFTPAEDHKIRVSGQSAFRAPTLQNQYILLDLGPISLLGNLNGFDNLYTKESVDSFQALYDSTFEIRPSELVPIVLDPIQPEQVRTLELGYRGIFKKKLYIDLVGYFNWYDNFIGDIRVARPNGGGIAGEESGEDAVLTESYDLHQIPTNAKETVRSWGIGFGLNYSIVKGLIAKANYTYADINTDDLTDPIIPGFNTPKHKFNIGMQGRKLWKGLGFNTNFKWVDNFQWQSPFGDGDVPSYYILDAQINYEYKVNDINMIFALGGSNLTGNDHIEAYGSPLIGRRFYASVLIDFLKL